MQPASRPVRSHRTIVGVVLASVLAVGLVPASILAASPAAALDLLSAPTGVVAAAGVEQVDLGWNVSVSSDGSTVDTYELCDSPSPDMSGQACQTQTWQSPITVHWVYSSLPAGAVRYFTVAAVDAAGTGSASAPMSATPFTVPDPPTGLIGTAVDQKAILNWSVPANDGGVPVARYAICYSVDALVWFAPTCANTPSATPTFTVVGLTNGTPYFFTVAAVNAAGTGPASPVSAAVTPLPIPDAPILLSSTQVGRSIHTAVAQTVAEGALQNVRYYVVSCTHGTTTRRASIYGALLAGQTALATVSVAVAGEYTCSVVAHNDVGDSPSSNSISLTVQQPPGPPSRVVATPGDGQVTMTWSPALSDGFSPITDYLAACRTIGGLYNYSHLGASRSVSVGGLTNGTPYQCTVIAVNGMGAGPAVTRVVTPRAVPGPPRGVSVIAGDRSIPIRWTPPELDGGSRVTRYVITCTSSSAPTRRIVVFGGQAPGSLERMATVTGVVAGSAYDCTVAARNAAGDGPPSAPVSVTADRSPGLPLSVVMTPGDGQVFMSWKPPSPNLGTPVVSYSVECREVIGGIAGGVVAAIVVAAVAAPMSGPVSGLTNGVDYRCTVAASNVVGTGPVVARIRTAGPKNGWPNVAVSASTAIPTVDQEMSLSASVAPGGAYSYRWALISRPAGSTAHLSDPSAAVPTLVPDRPGTYEFQVVVTDSTGRFVSGGIGFTAAIGPVVDAVTTSSVSGIADPTVVLTAMVTSTAGFAYQWSVQTRPPGSSAAMSDPAAANPSFTPDVAGSYLFRLVVTDSTGRSSLPSDVDLTVPDPPTGLVATAGSTVGSVVPTFFAPVGSIVDSYVGTCTSVTPGAASARSATSTSTSITIDGLNPGDPYDCGVVAMKGAGKSRTVYLGGHTFTPDVAGT